MTGGKDPGFGRLEMYADADPDVLSRDAIPKAWTASDLSTGCVEKEKTNGSPWNTNIEGAAEEDLERPLELQLLKGVVASKGIVPLCLVDIQHNCSYSSPFAFVACLHHQIVVYCHFSKT